MGLVWQMEGQETLTGTVLEELELKHPSPMLLVNRQE